ncbi:MAG: hypothetical protein AB8H80_04085 [Planctomycetota bacterium]
MVTAQTSGPTLRPASPIAETRAPDASAFRAARELARDVLLVVPQVTADLELAHADLAFTFLQMPLNHLGMRLVEHPFDAGRPENVDATRVRAIGTWLQPNDELPAWFWPWLEAQDPNLKMVHFGSLLPLANGDRGARLRRHLNRFGLDHDLLAVADPSVIDVRMPRPHVYPFESQPVYERIHFGPWIVDGDSRAWIETVDKRTPKRVRTPVVTGSWGGIGLQPWFLRPGGVALDRRWYADPFAFLAEALGVQHLPAPDPCVKHGRRMFLLHVDGDGFESQSTVVRGQNCGEVFRDRVVDAWPMPMSISYVVASLTDHLQPAEPNERMKVAREIVERPWVELASHSVLHPLNWRRRLNPRSLPRTVVWYRDLPGFRHDMAQEVRASIAFLDRWIAPTGKRCRVMFWSGAANPKVEALRAAREAGCYNLNGGLFRVDALYDSVGFVSPWGRSLDGEWQVFAGAANENEFDGFFTSMPGAFAHVSTTLERTGGARILKPANVYCHFYSVEHPARAAAFDGLLRRWVREENTIPVYASTYAASVLDAQSSCRMARTATGYAFAGFETCRTVRFDIDPGAIDWAKSKGLLGARRLGQRLFLDLAAASAEVSFVDGGKRSQAVKPWLFVEQASCGVASRAMDGRSIQLSVGGFGSRTIVLAGAPPSAELQVALDGAVRSIACDSQGRCEIALPERRVSGPTSEVRAWLP